MAMVQTGSARLRLPAWVSPALIVGGVVVLFWLVATAFPYWIAPHDPLDMVGRRLQAPSSSFLMGTDALGRDVFSRTVHGARYSLPIALLVVARAVVDVAPPGATAG